MQVIIERNDQNKKARGGTELMQERLHSSLPEDLLANFQIIPSRVRDIDKNKKTILWLHDLPTDPESRHLSSSESRKRFAKIVAVSNWQLQLYNLIHRVQYDECVVLKNAIPPIAIEKKEYDGVVRLIYHTTPHRGLEILVPVFEEISMQNSNVILDVYSSFSIYGWEERDLQYEKLFIRCRNHKKINYHGSVSNEEIRESLKKSHIFAYPSIWRETSCLAAMEAMSSMNRIVCPNLAALPETTAGFADMYPWTENVDTHKKRFKEQLLLAINKIQEDGPDQNHLQFQKSYADKMYSWEARSLEWEKLLRDILSTS